MKAMLLAAGFGKRLRPITDTTPKPLLEVGGKSLIEHQLERLREAGIQDVVINLHHLGDQIQSRLGDGAGLGINISYSLEPELLETGGGIKKALPLLGDSPFLVTSADTYLDFDLDNKMALMSDNYILRLMLYMLLMLPCMHAMYLAPLPHMFHLCVQGAMGVL